MRDTHQISVLLVYELPTPVLSARVYVVNRLQGCLRLLPHLQGVLEVGCP